MEKKQRIRYEVGAAMRLNAAAATARQDDLQIIRNKYDFSTGQLYARAIFVHGDSDRNY